MARTVKYDIGGEDPTRTGGAMPLPKKGWYNAKIDKVTRRKDKGDYEFQVVITDKKAKGFRLWDYIDFTNDNVRWKVAQFLVAVGEVKAKGKRWTKAKGSLDPEETVGTKVSVRIRHSSYEGEPTAKLGGWGPPLKGKAKDEDEDLEDDDLEDEEDEDEDGDEEQEEDDDTDDDDEDAEDEEDDDEDSDDEDDEEDEDEVDDEEEDDEEPEPAPKKRKAAPKKAAPKKAAKKPAKKGKVKRAKGDLPF